MRSPIIDRADLQTWQNLTLSGALTVFFWMFWAYLWLPLLAVAAWAVGIQQAHKYMIVLGGYQEVLRLVGLYTLIIVLICGSLYAWATYNILRYGSDERRIESRVQTDEQVARYFRQGPLAVQSWRQAHRLYVSHDEQGRIAQVDILASGTPVPEHANDAR
jgi:poly-beta-1,6-N-acetyl-D-glucosamine biosynthesis protein PgaD